MAFSLTGRAAGSFRRRPSFPPPPPFQFGADLLAAGFDDLEVERHAGREDEEGKGVALFVAHAEADALAAANAFRVRQLVAHLRMSGPAGGCDAGVFALAFPAWRGMHKRLRSRARNPSRVLKGRSGKTGSRTVASLDYYATSRPPVRRFLSAPVPLRPILFAFGAVSPEGFGLGPMCSSSTHRP